MSDDANYPAKPESVAKQTPRNQKPRRQLAPNRCIRPMVLGTIFGVNPNEPRIKSVLSMICGPFFAPTVPSLSSERRHAIETGEAWPSYRELLATQYFFQDNFYADLAKSCRLLLHYEGFTLRRLRSLNTGPTHSEMLHRLTKSLFEQIRSLSAQPTLQRFLNISQTLNQWRLNIPQDHWNIFHETEVLGRLEFYLACAYHEPSIIKIASACLHEAYNTHNPATTALAFRAAVGWLLMIPHKIQPGFHLNDSRHDDLHNGQIAARDGDIVITSILSHAYTGTFETLFAGTSIPAYTPPPPVKKKQESAEERKAFEDSVLQMLKDIREQSE